MAIENVEKPEAHRICNLVPSRDTERDWSLEHAIASSAIATPAAVLPERVDLREDWWNIGDQEGTGSCMGWASTDGVVRYHMVKAGKIAPPGLLSVRATWMSAKEMDEFSGCPETFIEIAGTSLKAVIEILRRYGTVPESMVPFHISTAIYSGDETLYFATAAQRRIAAYFNLRKDLDQWRIWLATHGPILAGLYIDETFANARATAGRLDGYRRDTVRGGHAVCVVGYTADRRVILRNSWGTAWGDQGYAYSSEEYIMAGFVDESYGVIV